MQAWLRAVPPRPARAALCTLTGTLRCPLGAALEAALGTLAGKFGAVFYCPGNHELWVRERDRWGGVGLLRAPHQVAPPVRPGPSSTPLRPARLRDTQPRLRRPRPLNPEHTAMGAPLARAHAGPAACSTR